MPTIRRNATEHAIRPGRTEISGRERFAARFGQMVRNSVVAKADVIEPKGWDKYLCLAVDEGDLGARLYPRNRTEVGGGLQIALNLDNMHLFVMRTRMLLT